MTAHAEYALRCPCVSEILDLLFAVAATKTGATECLITCENREVFNFVSTSIAAVRAVVAYQRSVAEQEEVRVGVE